MRKCLRCGREMTEGFILTQELSIMEIKLTDDENVLNKFGDLRAAVCPACGEVSLYSQNENLLEEKDEGQYILCPHCGYPVYEDEKECGYCGKKKNPLFRKRLKTRE